MNPFVVDTLGHQQTPVERKEADKQAAEAKAEEQYHRCIDRWMLFWAGVTAIATGILVFVGIGGVIAALKTLNEIKSTGEQTERMLKHAGVQAESAKVTADAIINGERAWIVIRPFQFKLMPVSPGAIPPYNEFCHDVINKGKTVAILVALNAEYRVTENDGKLPDIPVYNPRAANNVRICWQYC